jgi:hypothetical protein
MPKKYKPKENEMEQTMPTMRKFSSVHGLVFAIETQEPYARHCGRMKRNVK